MAGEQSKNYEVIYDMGSGLVIAKVNIDFVKEQDINARIMKNEMQDQLTQNISQLLTEKNRNDCRRSLICSQTVVISHVRCRFS